MDETVADIGEFGLIDRIHALLRKEGTQAPGLTLGIGDDTASFQPQTDSEVLVTCDCMVEGRHYLAEHITPLELGRRAMVMNISDIGAVGGRPLYALVSLGLKADTPVSHVEDMYRGFVQELNPFGAAVIGGNLTKSGNGAFIDITLIGDVEKGKAIRRSTAKVGNAILLTGYPGRSAAGLQLLRQSHETKNLRDHPLVRAYNTPSHRAWEGRAIGRSGCATAMIDISDGFLGDLGHICEESGVGALLIQEQLPIDADLHRVALQLEIDPYVLVLGDSDDYELIVTCSVDHVEKIQAAVAAVSRAPVTHVGTITDKTGDVRMILPDGTERSMSAAGWDHFIA
ncbi:MAG: thiamine-phosphate kinase [Desulfatiglandaceae bacterium]